MIRKALAAAVLAGMTMSAQAGVVINEGFADVAGLAAQGWSIVENSTPGGASDGWYQGVPAVFGSQAGAPNAYAAANYNNAPPGGTIDSWLITPEFDASGGVNISFYLRAAGDGWDDTLSYGFLGGAMTTVMPVPAGEWAMFTVSLAANLLDTARFAFRYGGTYDSANYVGLDTVVVETPDGAVPEPGTLALFAGGLMALSRLRRRKPA